MADAPQKKKVGKASKLEIEFLRKNHKTMKIPDIAAALNRNAETVQNWFNDLLYKDVEDPKLKEAAESLRTKPYWRDLVQQYNEHELELYEYHWAQWIDQFASDITHSEEIQIQKVIDLEIMLSRNRKKKNDVSKEIETIQKHLTKEIFVDEDAQNKELIIKLSHELTALRASESSHSKEYNDMLDKQQKMIRDLKATRDQRYKEVESKDITFFGWMKSWMDKRNAARMSKEAELMRLAAKKAGENLSEYHEYMDGMVDQPLLTADTVKEDNTLKGETQ